MGQGRAAKAEQEEIVTWAQTEDAPRERTKGVWVETGLERAG